MLCAVFTYKVSRWPSEMPFLAHAGDSGAALKRGRCYGADQNTLSSLMNARCGSSSSTTRSSLESPFAPFITKDVWSWPDENNSNLKCRFPSGLNKYTNDPSSDTFRHILVLLPSNRVTLGPS